MSEATVVLPENFTIHHIEQQSGDLRIAFQTDADTVKLDASQVETIDTSGLQLTLSLVKQALEQEKSIVWENPTDVFCTSAKKIGLNDKLQLPETE